MTVYRNRKPVPGTTRQATTEAKKIRVRAFRKKWKAIGRNLKRTSGIYGNRKR